MTGADIQGWMTSIGVLGTMLVSLFGALVSLHNGRKVLDLTEASEARGQAAHDSIAKVDAKVAAVIEQTNGMSHRLETLAGEAGEARGIAKAAADKKKP